MARKIGPDTAPSKIGIDWAGAPVLISDQTSDIIQSRSKHPAITLAVYWFLARCAMKQKTLQPWATTRFISNGLKISEARIKLAKTELVDFGLIEIVQERLKKGRGFGKVFTKVNYCSPDLLPPIIIDSNTNDPKCLGVREGKCLDVEEDKCLKEKNNKKEKVDGRFEELSIKEWFQEFWTKYPTKQGRKKAEEKWEQALKKNKNLRRTFRHMT